LGTEKARTIDIYCEFAQIRANLISRKCVVIKTDKSTGESIYEDYEVNADDALVSEHAAFNQLIEGKKSSICTADQGQWAVSLAEAAVNAIGSRS
jgi:hypothetical protein